MYFILSRQILVENFGPLKKTKKNQTCKKMFYFGFYCFNLFCVSPSYRVMININPSPLDFYHNITPLPSLSQSSEKSLSMKPSRTGPGFSYNPELGEAGQIWEASQVKHKSYVPTPDQAKR